MGAILSYGGILTGHAGTQAGRALLRLTPSTCESCTPEGRGIASVARRFDDAINRAQLMPRPSRPGLAKTPRMRLCRRATGRWPATGQVEARWSPAGLQAMARPSIYLPRIQKSGIARTMPLAG